MAVVDDEQWSKSCGAWGVAPVDRRPPAAISRGPGQWATANDYIPSLGTGVYFDSFQSLCAMGLFQLGVWPDVFLGGGGRRRGCRAPSVCRGPRVRLYFLSLSGSPAMYGWDSCLCIFSIRLCIRTSACTFSYLEQKCIIKKGNRQSPF